MNAPPAASGPPAAQREFAAGLPGHRYPVGMVRLFLDGTLECAASQRATAGMLGLVGPLLPGVTDTPCPNAGRMWLLRLGLHELTRPKTRGEDWAWIMDHTLQLGPWKCLVIVGVRLGSWDRARPLACEDLTLLDLAPMKESNGDAVHAAMLRAAEAAGVPREVVSDGGGELQRGMDLLQREHPKAARVYDVKHKMALLLKRELESDGRWAAFVTRSGQAKRETAQTALAFLAPPGLKAKARYMNLDTLVGWGVGVAGLLEGTPGVPDREARFGWVREYRGALAEWSELLGVAEAVNRHVRCHGYHRDAERELAEASPQASGFERVRRMRGAALEFVRSQSAAAAGDERLIGSSEVLESLIGRYKRLQGDHAKGGMTATLLGIGAIVGDRSADGIREGLGRVRSAQVGQWCRDNLGVTLQSQRMAAFAGNKNGIQNKLPAK